MKNTSPINGLSDLEFVNLMKAKATSKSWTLGELEEFERRGEAIFEAENGLLLAIQETIQKHFSSVQPQIDRVESQLKFVAARLKLDLKGSDFLKIRTPTFREVGIAAPGLRPYVITSPKLHDVETKITLEQGEKMLAQLIRISTNTKWDWKQWVQFVAALVAAITGLWTFIWGLTPYAL